MIDSCMINFATVWMRKWLLTSLQRLMECKSLNTHFHRIMSFPWNHPELINHSSSYLYIQGGKFLIRNLWIQLNSKDCMHPLLLQGVLSRINSHSRLSSMIIWRTQWVKVEVVGKRTHILFWRSTVLWSSNTRIHQLLTWNKNKRVFCREGH